MQGGKEGGRGREVEWRSHNIMVNINFWSQVFILVENLL